MSRRPTRRHFITRAAGTAGLAAMLPRQAPAFYVKSAIRPVVISSENGNEYKNGGELTSVAKAFDMMAKGADVLDALIAGVNICELDPEDDSVGYGGLPNANGVVQLDSSVMHGPSRRAGAVACLEGVRTPSHVAKAVLENTDHHLLVGADAQSFARQMGFTIENDLNTPHSRKLWLEWKRRTDPKHFPNPARRAEIGLRAAEEMCAEGLLSYRHLHGTINCDGVNSQGHVCGVTTTSGLAWKIPGRVGDSPILGAGLYVDNDVGAAGSTGRGEANLYNLCSFLIVEEMRRGKTPKDAGMIALKRIKANTIERRLKNNRGLPNFNVKFYVLNNQGEFAGVALFSHDPPEGKKPRRPSQFAVCTEDGPKTLPCEALLEGSYRD
jgi:N4-(beta-N-acetylglucosaminyl)-L-asparaginase